MPSPTGSQSPKFPNLAQLPRQVLADTGYRSEAVFAKFADGDTELIIALGREGKEQLKFHADRNPHTAAMATVLAATASSRWELPNAQHLTATR